MEKKNSTQETQNTVGFFQSKKDEFIDSIKESIDIWRNKGVPIQKNNELKQLTPSNKRYKYQQYERELEAGVLDAKESDRSDINLQINLENTNTIIREDHLDHKITDTDDKFRRSMRLYTNDQTVTEIIDRIQKVSIKSYKANMEKPCSKLLTNQQRIMSIRQQLHDKIAQNPNLLKEQDDLLYSKFNSAPKKQDSFTRDEVILKIDEINKDLKSIRRVNEELAEQIKIIEKAKSTLELEKSAIDVSIEFEKNRLKEANNSLRHVTGISSEIM